MSYLRKYFLLLCYLSFYPLSLSAQDYFEGIIRYEVDYSGKADQGMLVPGYTEYHIRGNDLILQMIGSDDKMMARILMNGESGTFYMIDDSARTALKVVISKKDIEGLGNVPEEFREEFEKALIEAEKESEFDQFDLENTGETAVIAGYDCARYLIRSVGEDAPADTEVWLTKDIRVAIPDVLKDKNNPLLIFMDESGFPLKFNGISGSGAQTHSIRMEAVKVSRISLNPSDFTVPADYHISDMTGLLEGR